MNPLPETVTVAPSVERDDGVSILITGTDDIAANWLPVLVGNACVAGTWVSIPERRVSKAANEERVVGIIAGGMM